MNMKTASNFRSILYRGIFATLVGILALFPSINIITFILVIGVAFMLAGVISFWFRFKNPHNKKIINILQLIGAISSFIFGFLLIYMTDAFEKGFTSVVGGIIIFAAIVKLFDALCISPMTNKSKIFLGISLLLIILGTIFIFYQFDQKTVEAVFFGLILSIYGISNIFMSFWVRSCVIEKKQIGGTLPESDIENVTEEISVEDASEDMKEDSDTSEDKSKQDDNHEKDEKVNNDENDKKQEQNDEKKSDD